MTGACWGVISTYHDLPIANLTFAARSGELVGPLIMERMYLTSFTR